MLLGVGDDPAGDAAEAGELYDHLEREVIPEFHTRDAQGIPSAWIARMRESMAQLTPRLSSNRVVREYTDRYVFEVQVHLDDLDQQAVRIELYANGIDGAAPERVEMARLRQLAGAARGYFYRATVPATPPATDYTARLMPSHDDVAIPLESVQILWQR